MADILKLIPSGKSFKELQGTVDQIGALVVALMRGLSRERKPVLDAALDHLLATQAAYRSHASTNKQKQAALDAAVQTLRAFVAISDLDSE